MAHEPRESGTQGPARTHIRFVVQHAVRDWCDLKPSHDDEADAREHYNACRRRFSAGRFRLIRRLTVVTEDVLADSRAAATAPAPPSADGGTR